MRSPVRFSIALSGVPAPRNEPQLLSPQQVAERCNLSYGGVVAAINRGELRAARLGRRLRIPADAVDEWVESQMVRPRRTAAPSGVAAGAGARSPIGCGERRPVDGVGA